MDITSSYIVCIVGVVLLLGIIKLVETIFPQKTEEQKKATPLSQEDLIRIKQECEKIDKEIEEEDYQLTLDYYTNTPSSQYIPEDVGYSINISPGTEMTIGAFVAFHGDYEVKQANDSSHYLQTKDGTCVFMVHELEDLLHKAEEKGEVFRLDETKLKVRKRYSMKDKYSKYWAYYNYKGKV